jgi:malonyl-CoA/methylmalonyl-CoA synthetase
MTNLYSTLALRFHPHLDSTFLRIPGEVSLTYRDVDNRSAQMAAVLRDLGVKTGDRVAVQVDKSTDNVALYMACLRIGAVYLPLNVGYTAAEVTYFIDDAAPSLVVARPDTLSDLPTGVVHLGSNGEGSFATASDRAAAWDEVVERGPDDLAAMLYTSGTTGRSKGAMLTHANLTSNALALHEIWGFGAQDVLLHTLPIFHVHGLFVALHCAMLGGNEVIFLRNFDVGQVVRELPHATVMMGVPTQYTRLLGEERFTAKVCEAIRLFTSGSAPMTETVHAEFTSRTGMQILERYGMTEAGMITSNPYDGERVPGTVGFPLPDVELRVCDGEGNPLPTGETGTVEIRSPGLFAGYWQRAAETAASYRDHGWFITGDVGSVDLEHRLTLEGRTSDMIISGGYNVYPREIEMVLDELPGVLETAVIGVPHPDFGEAVAAIVVRDGTVDISDEQLGASLDGVLARYKHPKRYIAADELPRNTMSKVQKAALRAKHAHLFSPSNEG